MGLISFIKDAGKKLKEFGNRNVDHDNSNVVQAETPTAQDYQAALLNYLRDFNLKSDKIEAMYDGNGKVTLKGEVDSELEKARIITTVGNIHGVSAVEDHLTVTNSDGSNVRYREVVSGDTLSAIAKEMYGDASKYPVIFEANKPMLKDADEIYPGQKLVIPALK